MSDLTAVRRRARAGHPARELSAREVVDAHLDRIAAVDGVVADGPTATSATPTSTPSSPSPPAGPAPTPTTSTSAVPPAPDLSRSPGCRSR
jgi:hypothetical protein